MIRLTNIYSHPRGKRYRRLVVFFGHSRWVPMPRRFNPYRNHVAEALAAARGMENG